MICMATEVSAQGFGSFVDAPRTLAVSLTNQRGQPIRDDMPAAVQATLHKLASIRSSVIAPECTLAELQSQLNRLGIPTILDIHSLEDENISPVDVVQMPAAELPLGQGLKHALGELDCIWTLNARGTVLILTEAAEEELSLTVSYDVTGLIAQDDYDALINVITSTVEPDSWDDVGGPGTVQAAPVGRRDLLVVASRFHVQLETRRLLNSLARMSAASTASLSGALPRRPRVPEKLGMAAPGSSVIAMPRQPKKRGIGLPNHAGDGSTSNFGGFGGMAGGMF